MKNVTGFVLSSFEGIYSNTEEADRRKILHSAKDQLIES